MKIIDPFFRGGTKLQTKSLGEVLLTVDLHREARENRLRVIEAAMAVEEKMEEIIVEYFFQDSAGRAQVFKQLVIDSDWCTFSAKRKMLNHIVGASGLNLLEAKAKQNFDELIGKVVKFRNAFAHGEFYMDTQTVRLHYFEGQPKVHDLSDDFLTQVESTFENAMQQLFVLKEEIKPTLSQDSRDQSQ